MSSVFRQRGSSTDSTTAFSAGRIAQGKGRVVVVVSGYDSAAFYRGFAAQIAQLGYDDLGAPPLRNQKFADLYGSFPVKWFFGLLPVLCWERKRPFFVASPAIRFPERAEGVEGPKC